MIILHVGPVDWKLPSGLNYSIPSSVAHQSEAEGYMAALYTVDPNPAIPERPSYPVFLSASHPSILALPSPFSRPDLVVFHSTYIRSYIAISRALRAADIPYIIAPRGGLTSEAQKHKLWKKQIANLTVFRPFFQNARGFHFLNSSEATSSLNWERPYFIAPNGITLPSVESIGKPGSRKQLKLTFVGRIRSHIKGLDILVDACELVKSDLVNNDVTVELFGSRSGDDTDELRSRIRRGGLDGIVMLKPRIFAVERDDVLRNTDIFILPSRTEGHPIAALEALSFGIPSIASKGARIGEELVERGAGWMTNGSAESLAEAIRHAIAEKSRLSDMGCNGRKLVEEKYSWSLVTNLTLKGYRSLLDTER